MAEYKICFSIGGNFGAQMSFSSDAIVSYDELAKSVDKEKLVEVLCLGTMGYTADDIEIITPEQYDEEFGEDG